MPLEVRFLHDPNALTGFVGCALTANVFRFYRDDESKEWRAEKVIDVPAWDVSGWTLPQMPGIITDILISLDDRFLYISNWVQGDIRQYDITDPAKPRLNSRVFVGGCAVRDSDVRVTRPVDGVDDPRPEPLVVGQDRRVDGGPQMLQLSLDGRRLYVTTSLFSPWDRQFFPEMVKRGSVLLRIDIDVDGDGTMTLDRRFVVDFGAEPDGPVLAHEIRYPGGDCTSDIWL